MFESVSKKLPLRKIFVLLIILMIPLTARSQTQVSGNQSGVWSAANSPYLVTGDVTIPPGDSLIIEPGVEIKFQGYFKFVVNGYFSAVGTESDSILFTTDSGVADWRGVRFIDADTTGRLSYCRFENGRSSGDWPDNSGGGVSLWNTSISIDHCDFINNRAEHLGGGLFCWNSHPQVENCTFRGNDCVYDGGAVYLYFSNGDFSRCEFSDNTTGYYGAAVCCETSYSTFEYCLMNGNIAQSQAGGLRANFSEINLTNCTITANSTAGWGGALYLVYTTANITNCIIWNNPGYGGEIYLDIQGFANVNYSNVNGSFSGANNLNTNPLFVDPINRDFHLSATSPCIDAGTAFFTLGNDTLVNLDSSQYAGSAPDMGAFEYGMPTNLRQLPEGSLQAFELYRNYPNPFNPVTHIGFRIPDLSKGAGGFVELKIYDLLGREIKTLVNTRLLPGSYTVIWDGRDNEGRAVASGAYLYRLTAGKYTATKKMMLLR